MGRDTLNVTFRIDYSIKDKEDWQPLLDGVDKVDTVAQQLKMALNGQEKICTTPSVVSLFSNQASFLRLVSAGFNKISNESLTNM